MRVIRLDWRLIHSNTIDFWIRPLGLTSVVLCDAQVAADPLKQLGLKLMSPSDITVEFVHPEALCENLSWVDSLVLFRDLGQYQLSGLKLNPGDVIAISPHQPLSAEELNLLTELAAQGIQTTFEAIMAP